MPTDIVIDNTCERAGEYADSTAPRGKQYHLINNSTGVEVVNVSVYGRR